MCEMCSADPGAVSRRHFVVAGAAGLISVAAVSGRATALPKSPGAVPRPEILPRDMWAQGRAPKGPISAEKPKFLLVHHTAEPGNDYTSDDVPSLLQGIFAYHTGSAKGWPDVAYNFFIDSDGRIWEGRQGSIAGPVRGSATGGNQGWSQLCCFLGNFESELPSQAAQESMVALLAWLGDRYDIDTSPGATVELESQGSNRWPAGSTITTSTIAGHRDMSMTTCPGDSAYAWVTSILPASVTTLRLAQAPLTTTSALAPTTHPTAVSTPTTAPQTTEPEAAHGSATVERPRGTGAADSIDDSDGPDGDTGDESGGGMSGPAKATLAAGAVLAAGAGATGLMRARQQHGQRRHVGSYWVLTAYSPRDSAHAGAIGHRTGGGRSSDSERSAALPHIGTDGVIAWVIHGGWPAETIESAVADLAHVASSSGLRNAGSELVGQLGPSPDGNATVMLFLAHGDDAETTFRILGVGRGQISVQNATDSDLISCPVETELTSGSSFRVRLDDGATEVTVEPTPEGASP